MDSAWAYVMAIFTAMMLFAGGVALAAGDPGADATVRAPTTATPTTAVPATAVVEAIVEATTTTIAQVVVPEVTGLGQYVAGARLREVGLEPEYVAVPAAVAFAIDVSVSQSLAPGSLALPGDVVVVEIGRRPAPQLVARAVVLDWDAVVWVDVVSAEPGRCSVTVPQDDGARLDRVDCTEPHDFEYVSTLDLSGFPDSETADGAVFDLCWASILEYVGIPQDGYTDLLAQTVSPGQGNWAIGARESHCLVAATDRGVNQLVGSAQGSLW